MATGVIDRNYNRKEPRKQVLLVVTSGWSVMCFDHNLMKLWDVNLQLHMDPFEEIELAEKNAEQNRRSASEKEDIEGHSSDASQLIPQHKYKLNAHALNSRHPGEFECRKFRESVLSVMPHHWDQREDTLLELVHFRLHKRKTVKKFPGKTSNYPLHKPEENHPPGKDTTKKISNVIGKAVNYAKSAKSKKPLPYMPTITNYTQLWWVPNVVVAHQKEGIEAVHLASGRTLCKLHLQEGGLHADISGDGSPRSCPGCGCKWC